jgi:transcriptional regulator GlxA family with amidase domain
MAAHRIQILVYEGCMASEVMAIADLFHIANKLSLHRRPGEKGKLFSVELIGMRSVSVTTANGMHIDSRVTGKSEGRLLIVPGLDFDNARAMLQRLTHLAPEIALIREAAQRGASIASICVGAFLLAEAGVLDGRKATTSWLLNGVLAKRYPKVKFDLNAMVTEDDGVFCAGAVTAAYDLGLKLIDRYADGDLAQMVAKVMLLEPNRRSQAPFVFTSLEAQARDTLVAQACKWLHRHIGQHFSIDEVAAHFAVSPRTLLRRFREEIHDTPIGYLQKIRLEHAKALLETTHLSFVQIVDRAGYFDESAFRRLFKRHVGLTPIEYRKRFSIHRK